jgi:hypothetical protein
LLLSSLAPVSSSSIGRSVPSAGGLLPRPIRGGSLLECGWCSHNANT